MYKLLILTLLITISSSYPLLEQIPITFKIDGNISYTPTSGGVNIPGYILKIGFNKFSWIGVKFMSLTSRSNYDVIVVSRDSSNVGGYYQTTYNDYFLSSARQTQLISDSVNSMDKIVQTYSTSNYFQIDIYRTKGNTQGQDWQGGEFVKVCFYTSANRFDQTVWTGLSENCYGYDISADYVSTYRGKYISSMQFDGVNTEVYGGIQGPVLQTILFWYCPKSTLSSSDVYIRSGAQISNDLGYDYYKCGVGDFFGKDTSTLTQDTTWSGYNDGQCTVSSSSVGTKVAYHKLIYTNDQFDSILSVSPQICVNVGSNSVCQTLNLQLLCPIMNVDSALVIWQFNLKLKFLWLFVTLLAIYLK